MARFIAATWRSLLITRFNDGRLGLLLLFRLTVHKVGEASLVPCEVTPDPGRHESDLP